MNAKTIIGFINETLKGQRIVFGKQVTEERAEKIIFAIIGELEYKSEVTQEVLKYCRENYGYSKL